MNDYCIVSHRYITTLPKTLTTVTQIKTYLQAYTVYTQIVYIIFTFQKIHEKFKRIRIKLYLELIKNLDGDVCKITQIDISVCSACQLLLITLCPYTESEFLDCSKISISIHFCCHQHNPDFPCDLLYVVVGRRNYGNV